jgi:hypothetical protein
MKYLVIVAQETADGQIASAMTPYDDKNKALSAYHSELASALVSKSVKADTVAVITTEGGVLNITHIGGTENVDYSILA